jgi:UDP-glucose 4-epimerase
MDLVKGITQATYLKHNETGAHVYNLGTGNKHSQLELVHCFQKTTGTSFAVDIESAHPGQPVHYNWADSTKACNELNFFPQRTLQDMCRDAWHFHQKNAHVC